MPGPTPAATRRPVIPSMSNATPATAVMNAEHSLARGSIGEGDATARSLPRPAGGDGDPRRPGPDGLSVLLAGQVAAHRAHRIPLRAGHRAGGGHGSARYRHHLGCR